MRSFGTQNTQIVVYINQGFCLSFLFLSALLKMAQNTSPLPPPNLTDGDEFFNNLINYDEEHDELLLPTNTPTIEQPTVTFLEPNTDPSPIKMNNHQNEIFNMNNENLKKMMSDQGKSQPDTK